MKNILNATRYEFEVEYETFQGISNNTTRAVSSCLSFYHCDNIGF